MNNNTKVKRKPTLFLKKLIMNMWYFMSKVAKYMSLTQPPKRSGNIYGNQER